MRLYIHQHNSPVTVAFNHSRVCCIIPVVFHLI